QALKEVAEGTLPEQSRTKRGDGISSETWELLRESILGALGTAVLNLCIVVAALRYRKVRGADAAA
ncbi:MAG: hypothetical protein ACKOYN_00875, partial [Planctomycetota bacterium]